MSPAVKNVLLLGVVVVVLIGAAFMFRSRTKDRSYPDDPKLRTQWICEKCSKHFELTPAVSHDWETSKDKIRRDPNYPASVIVFWCPDCSTFSVVRARVNKGTGEWTFTRDSLGNPVGGAGESKTAGKGARPGAKPAETKQ